MRGVHNSGVLRALERETDKSPRRIDRCVEEIPCWESGLRLAASPAHLEAADQISEGIARLQRIQKAVAGFSEDMLL